VVQGGLDRPFARLESSLRFVGKIRFFRQGGLGERKVRSQCQHGSERFCTSQELKGDECRIYQIFLQRAEQANLHSNVSLGPWVLMLEQMADPTIKKKGEHIVDISTKE
jgi:hypothetical protein